MLSFVLVCAIAVSGCAANPTVSPSGPAGPSVTPGPENGCAPVGIVPPLSYPGWPGSNTAPPAGNIIPIPVSSEIAVGQNRFVFTLIDGQNDLLAAANVTVGLKFFNLAADPATTALTADSAFLTTSTGRGFYRTSVDFPCSGDWGIEFAVATAGAAAQTVRMIIPVAATWSTPAVGASVPSVVTPTATTAAGIAAISTDTDPDPDFYNVSEDEALAAHHPFVLVFATPAFCKTAVCGPTLDLVKSVAPPFKDKLTFIHVEPYILAEQDGTLQPVLDATGNFQAVPSVIAFGMASEPYTFVVGADGKLITKFEGVTGQDELIAALTQAAGGC